MAQVFSPSANTISKFSLILLVFLAAGGLCALDVIHKSPYVRYTGVARSQPVPFSHKHHTNMGIDCRYCHNTVEDSSFANIPPTHVCMNCHKEIFSNADLLEPVRSSYENGEPLEWVRVTDLPDHVYFNHSIHINKGIGCETCHGPVNEMPLMRREEPLFMRWCLDCHREPEKFIRPRDKVFEFGYEPEEDQLELGKRLVAEHNVPTDLSLTDCWICHR